MLSVTTIRPEIPALTGLRFIAALSVLVSHSIGNLFMLAGGSEHAWHLAILDVAGIGMPLFFVLSGFVIHYNYADQIRDRGAAGLANFFVARFARLYPLYALCVAFELVIPYFYQRLDLGQA